MRALVISLLVTTLLVPPAVAQDRRTHPTDQQKEDREQRKKDQKANRSQRPARPTAQTPPQRQPSTTVARPARPTPQPSATRPTRPDRPAQNVRPTRPVQPTPGVRPDRPTRPTVVQRPNPVVVPQPTTRPAVSVSRPGSTYVRPVRPPRGARPDVQAPRPQTTQRVITPRWQNNWRYDRRYDWRDYRHRNRIIFQLGRYYDPYGWNYRRYNVGWRLWPTFYSQNYWISDPYYYRLPQAPWPLQWVRYYNDALLVNTMSGQIVDVAYGVFW